MSRVKDFLVKPWRPEVAGLVIGIVASLQILVIRSPWYITGPETQFGGWLLKTLTLGAVKVDLWDYFNPSSPMFVAKALGPLENPGFQIVLGFMLGAAIAKALQGAWRLRWPANWGVVITSIIGGLLLGFGARLALGCNVGNFFATVQSLVFSGFVFFLGMAMGTYVATFLIETWLMDRIAKTRPIRISIGGNVDNRKVLATAVAITAALSLYWWQIGVMAGLLYLLFGVAYGFAGAKADICFTSMLRDGFWSRLAPYGANARAVAIALSITITANLVLKYGVGYSYSEFLFPVGIHTLLGGFLFGIGMVLVAGCSFSSAYRSGEGSIPHLIAWIFMIIGMTLLAYVWPFFYTTAVALSPVLTLPEMLHGNVAAAAALGYLFCLFLALYPSIRDGTIQLSQLNIKLPKLLITRSK
ncbi:YeeE/YedE family protein [Pyrobaculum calidifontis]|uniref:Sulphur transport domain-containing protein n=1 Tax=Pyrobaculum calidifontis (strain DSM 21063 / JCM 11548 / VA1) TaxID=410359 RepID=A3MW80_PYRCJ|nr:YeeE/YedE family protein [Pyrobaculum calidifontis]ABO08897.1 protein of unknown function DUF395, YeeE/YedE [Pyrobaculum calidifontis JCM 11548]